MQLKRNVLFAIMIIVFIYFEIHSCAEDKALEPEREGEISCILYNANDVYFADQDYGWVVGQEGTVVRTTDGGETWQGSRIEDIDIRGVNFLDREKGWVVGRGGRIFQTLDGGSTWESVAFSGYPRDDDFFQVVFMNENLGFILGYHGLFRTENGGVLWRNYWLPVIPYRGAWDMDIIDENRAFLLGSNWSESDPELLYFTDDGGIRWSEIPGSNASIMKAILTMEFIDENTGWAGGGRLMKTVDGGKNWEIQLAEATVREFCFIDDQCGFAVGGPAVLKTENGGTHWEDTVAGDERIVDLRGTYFLDRSRGWVVGRGREGWIEGKPYRYSVILSTIDGGTTWKVRELPYEISEDLSQPEEQNDFFH
ncbi:MAG: hypothetical protein JXB45_12465 [Candidatus Krumholzibacteriota bacterium]|nr:hypothetical protein [Candidatus Krumholzibacteriota bacterium]